MKTIRDELLNLKSRAQCASCSTNYIHALAQFPAAGFQLTALACAKFGQSVEQTDESSALTVSSLTSGCYRARASRDPCA
jgi:hypothetical protein